MPMSARLLIHTSEGARSPDGWLHAALQGLRHFAGPRAADAVAPPARLCVVDLQGRTHFAGEATQPPIDVPLPPGTYHVNVRFGAAERRYTVTLEHGATVDLHLSLPK